MNTTRRQTRPGNESANVAPWRLGMPRRAFWGLLIGALVVALALPLLTLWRASAEGLAARACIWPTLPRAGTAAQILVVMPASAAKSVQDGAPTMQVETTMPGMAMPAEWVSENAAPQELRGEATFTAPINVSMPGTWEARVTMRAMGRPVWHDTITFDAQPSGWKNLPLSAQSAGASAPCAVSPSATSTSQRASVIASQTDLMDWAT